MELPTYQANIPHHRASLLCHLNQYRKIKLPATYWKYASNEPHPSVLIRARIRRDLQSLNGLAGQW